MSVTKPVRTQGGQLRPLMGVAAFRRLWLAQLVSELGDWAARLALTVLVYNRTHSPALVGLVTAASLLPWLGPGQLLTAASERWSRRRVLVTSDLVRAIVFASAALPLPVPLLIVLVFCAGLATPPFEAARSALRPEVVPAPLYPTSVAVCGITEDVSLAAGYLAGGALVALVGAPVALLCNGASFALSALLLARLPATAAARGAAQPGGLRPAARALRSDPVIVRAAGLVTASMLTATGLIAMAAPLVLRELQGGASGVGALVAAATVISMVMTAAVTRNQPPEVLLRRGARLTAAGGAIVVVSFALLATRVGPATVLTALGFAGAGLLLAVLGPANVIVGPRLPGHLRAGGLSLLMGLLAATEALSASVAGALASVIALPVVCIALGVPPLVAGGQALLRPLVGGKGARP